MADVDYTPLRALAAAVIGCAWKDAKHGGAEAPEAREWLLGSDVEVWASIAGVDVDALRDRVRALPAERVTARRRTAA